MDELKTLEAGGLASGFTLPSPAWLFGSLVFGLIGWAAYRYGKKLEDWLIRGIGIALMLYPYLISDTVMLYGVGAALCFSLYWFRR